MCSTSCFLNLKIRREIEGFHVRCSSLVVRLNVCTKCRRLQSEVAYEHPQVSLASAMYTRTAMGIPFLTSHIPVYAAFLCACCCRASEYTLAQVHACFDALDSVVKRRKATIDERASRETQLLARGAWKSVQKAITTDKASTLGRHC